jgi:thiosulfate/3-mercaptopyruvate sulfurtransferase
LKMLFFFFRRVPTTVQRTAAAAVSVTVGSRLASTAAASTIIEAAKARQLLESKEAKFIDVRAPESYSEGHIPTAANVHTLFTYLPTSDDRGVRDLTDTFTEELRNAGIDGNEHVVTYENSLNTLYGASCRAFYILRLLGHPRVSVLGGGYEGWVQDGHPTTTEAKQLAKGTFQPKWNPSMWKGKMDVTEVLGDPNTVLLDVRDLDEWKGESSSPYGVDFAPRKGRLPGATHILWKDFMETRESGQMRFKRPEEIRSMCEAKGVTPDKEVIVYCFKGARASNTYLALKDAGFENVSNYFASWNEWSRDDKLEIDSKLLEEQSKTSSLH